MNKTNSAYIKLFFLFKKTMSLTRYTRINTAQYIYILQVSCNVNYNHFIQ